jgi:hypothetical protein
MEPFLIVVAIFVLFIAALVAIKLIGDKLQRDSNLRAQADFRNQVALAPGGPEAWQEISVAGNKLMRALGMKTLCLTFNENPT